MIALLVAVVKRLFGQKQELYKFGIYTKKGQFFIYLVLQSLLRLSSTNVMDDVYRWLTPSI